MVKESIVIRRTAPETANPRKDRVPLAQTNATEEHPYADVVGAFENDPMLDAMMANVRARRREIDADETIA